MTDVSTSLARRNELTKAWGFTSPWAAEASLRAALEDGKPLPATPALSFSTREAYLAARAAWRARQKAIETEIRMLKKARKGGSDEASNAAMMATTWRVVARAALIERKLQKAEARRQVEAARAVEAEEASVAA